MGSKQPEKGPKPAMAPKRQNPVAAQMSRADSLRSMGEFGKVMTTAEQAKARAAMQNQKKPGHHRYEGIRDKENAGQVWPLVPRVE